MGGGGQLRGSGRRRILHTTLRKCINGILMLRYFTGRQFGGGQLRVQVTVDRRMGLPFLAFQLCELKAKTIKNFKLPPNS